MRKPLTSLLKAIEKISSAPVACVELAAQKERYEQLGSKYQRLQEQNLWLSELAQSAAQMLDQESLSTLLDHIACEVISVSCANGAYMHMVHETGDYLEVVAAHGALTKQLYGETRILGEGLSGTAWQTGKLQIAVNYNSHENCVMDLEEEIQAIALPLVHADIILGVIFITAAGHEHIENDVDLIEQTAAVASLAIHHARQREATERELIRTQALSQLSTLMHQYQNLRDMAEHICPKLIDMLDLTRVTLYQVNNSTDDLECCSTWEVVDNTITRSESIGSRFVHETINSWSYKNKQTARIYRNVEDPRESADVHAFRRKKDLGATLCVPVMSEDTVLGLLTICRSMKKRDFDENDVNIFNTVVGQLSTAIQRNTLLLTVQHQALHDSLTQLPNRRGFESHLSSLLEENADGERRSAVMFFDLDGFKDVNDTFGHAVGDSVLRLVANRLDKCLGESGFLARLGGDEFAVALTQLDNDAEAFSIAEAMSEQFDDPFEVQGSALNLGTSVGISYYPDDGETLDDLVKHADMAMYQAKRSGRNRIVKYDEQLEITFRDEHTRKADLKKAVAEKEFELWYQPQVSLDTNHVSGVEALIRWQHPTRGIVSPMEFIPLAEEIGLISTIGSLVLENGCQQLEDWQCMDVGTLHLGINVAAPQFMNKRFGEIVLKALDLHQIAPEQLQLEVTESVFMNDLDVVLANLNMLRASGIRIAIDDFGTGFSSLQYLQDLPLDVLKIDRAFINKLNSENMLNSLANTIVLLAGRFGLETVAEGVETLEQLNLVRQLDCDLVQGYYFSKPVTASQLPGVIHGINGTATNFKKCA